MSKVISPPVIRFTPQAIQQIRALTAKCDIEISAFGVVADKAYHLRHKIPAGEIYILEFFPVKQTCSGVRTEMHADALTDLLIRIQDLGYSSSQLCVWWHSHVNMAVTPSSTDESTIDGFDFDQPVVSIITNKKREISLRVDMFKPFRWTWEKLEYYVDSVPVLPDNWAEKVVEEYVIQQAPERVYPVASTNWYAKFGGHQHGSHGGFQPTSTGYTKTYRNGNTPPTRQEVDKKHNKLGNWLLEESWENGIIPDDKALFYLQAIISGDMSTDAVTIQLTKEYGDKLKEATVLTDTTQAKIEASTQNSAGSSGGEEIENDKAKKSKPPAQEEAPA